MKVVKKTAEYTVYQKRNNRYGVQGNNKQWINSDDKVKILLTEGLITVSEPAAPSEPEAEEEAEESTDEASEETAEAEKDAD